MLQPRTLKMGFTASLSAMMSGIEGCAGWGLAAAAAAGVGLGAGQHAFDRVCCSRARRSSTVTSCASASEGCSAGSSALGCWCRLASRLAAEPATAIPAAAALPWLLLVLGRPFTLSVGWAASGRCWGAASCCCSCAERRVMYLLLPASSDQLPCCWLFAAELRRSCDDCKLVATAPVPALLVPCCGSLVAGAASSGMIASWRGASCRLEPSLGWLAAVDLLAWLLRSLPPRAGCGDSAAG
jgi:hypothetical protein